jgi:hypothetical protein
MMYKDGFGTTNNIKQCRNLLNIAVSRGHLLAKQDLERDEAGLNRSGIPESPGF